MKQHDILEKDTLSKKHPRGPSHLVPLAAIGAFALVAAVVMAGCLDGTGNGGTWQIQEVLTGNEVPDSLQNCEFQEDPDAEVGEITDEADIEDAPMPIEVGMQFLAPTGIKDCEDAPYLISVSMVRYSSEDFEQVKQEYEEMFQNDWDDDWEEYDSGAEDPGFDYCDYATFMWGDNRVVSASPMDPRMMTGEWDGTQDPMTGHEEDYQKVRSVLIGKYPNMDGPC